MKPPRHRALLRHWSFGGGGKKKGEREKKKKTSIPDSSRRAVLEDGSPALPIMPSGNGEDATSPAEGGDEKKKKGVGENKFT